MKIIWTDSVALDVPGIGLCYPGDIKEVGDTLGQSLIDQGQAERVKKKSKSKKNEEG